MTLSDLSIRRPVFAWMLMLALIVFGTLCFYEMGISQLPDVDFPVLNVSVTWSGASPDAMESGVTDVIEDAVMGVEGIRNVSSQVMEGVSNTTIEFELSRSVDVALQEVQSKIAQAQRNLPTDIDPPIVTKSNPEDQPILWLSLTGPTSLREKCLFVRDRLKDMLTTVDGVGDLRLGGYVDPNMRVWVDSRRMQSLELTVDDVINAIRSGTTLTPSGYMDQGPRETNIRVMSEAQTPEEFAKLIFPSRSGQPVFSTLRLGDVARVEEGVADVRRISRFNGESSVSVGVVKQRGSNAVAVGDAVKKRVREVDASLPANMKLSVAVDNTRFIRESTHELLFTLGLAALLTSIVCFLFLGSFGSAFNVVLAIPTSLLGSFLFLRYFGFTLNSFTLLALSLSIGIVVDDAIMVLENIVRYFEGGMSRVKAALTGAREITPAAVAASVAILAIFLPIVFMKGIVGRFFFQFGIAMGAAVTLSLLEALTLAPMRTSLFLTEKKDWWLTRNVDRGMGWLRDRYAALLGWCLHHRAPVLLASLAIFAGSLLLLKGVNREFLPSQDQSMFMVNLYTPMGSSLDFTDSVFKQAEAAIRARPEVNGLYSAVGGFQGGLVNQGILFVMLKNPGDRPVQAPFHKRPGQQELMGLVRGSLQKIPGVERVSVIDLSQQGFSAKRGSPITFSVQGPDWEQLAAVSRRLMERMKTSGLMTDVDSDYNPNMPEARVHPDREAALRYGVTIDTIAESISTLMGSLRVAKYTDPSGHRDDIRVKIQQSQGETPQDIRRIWVRNVHGEIVPLWRLIRIEEKSSLLTIGRYNRERAVTIYANVATGKSQAAAMSWIDAETKKLLPPGVHYVVSGSSQAFQESFTSLLVALVLGILVAYMVLGAQFNSFLHPIVVLLALPFSATGAFLALRLTGITLNLYSMIGMLLLMGIVKKNSILLVDFTNHQRRDGLGVREALLKACPLRLRPILMTSVATVAAAVPAAVALGPGSETMRPMAVVVIGGVIFSTLLTLVVVPCAYSALARLESHKHEKELAEALRENGGRPRKVA